MFCFVITSPACTPIQYRLCFSFHVRDGAGFRFPTTLIHTIEQKLRFETDSPEVVNECIRAVKKGGRVSLIGDYFMYANHFALGPMMEKSITVRGG